MASAIVINVEERCQCGFTRSNITSDGFRCFPGSTDVVTYRGEIHETDTVNVFDMITHIEEWTAEGVSILVQRVFIEVDGSCRVAIESFNEEECLPRRTITATSISTTERETDSPPNNGSVAIIGGGAAAVVMLLILIIGIIVVMKRCRASYKLEDNKNRHNVYFKMTSQTFCIRYTLSSFFVRS